MMAAKKLYYCGGYGGRHIIPGAGRPYISCPRCRLSPNHRDSDEHLARVIESMKLKPRKVAP